MPKKVDFGFEDVTPEEKTERVREVFQTVARRYDLMNDVMSLGLHRILKRIALESTALRLGDTALDLAGGTGDMSRHLARATGRDGFVALLDINEKMVSVGRDQLIDNGFERVRPVIGNAESLPFENDSFDAIACAFGLRNFTDIDRALHEAHRVLKQEGRIVVLEFSKPDNKVLRTLNRLYQMTWPIAGRAIVGTAKPYQYLIESIEKHPSQRALAVMMEDAGFQCVKYEHLLSGVVVIHQGMR